MNINRHNYEEYFILYMDNELNGEQRRMVEAFAQQHPDLKDELDNLFQYKLLPDTAIIFEGKEELLKENGHSLITLTNYEEWLSLYTDKELNAEQKLLVEKFIAGNPSMAKELELFQKTRLHPETVIFPSKESLYRSEKLTDSNRERRILPFNWRATAAVLILALGLTAVLTLNKKPTANKPEVAGIKKNQSSPSELNNTETQPGKNNPVTGGTGTATEQKNNPINTPFVAEAKKPVNTVSENKNILKNSSATASKKPVAPVANTIADNIPAVIKKDEQVITGNKPSNNLPQPMNNANVISNNKPDEAVAYNKPDESKTANTSPIPDVTNKTTQPSNIVQASYNGNNDDAIFNQPDEKKNKSRGIFRKIARTFEKRTNIDPTDDNKLLVAGLAIKLK